MVQIDLLKLPVLKILDALVSYKYLFFVVISDIAHIFLEPLHHPVQQKVDGELDVFSGSSGCFDVRNTEKQK